MSRFLDWLASFRLRLLFRASFLLLGVAVLALAVTVLQEEKQRSTDQYQERLAKTRAQIVALLRHPSGQLALLNPRSREAVTPLSPVVLPYSAIDFDDQTKVRNAVEMAGCLVRYPKEGSVCVAIGSNPWAGGYIYVAGTFASGELAAHRIGDVFLDGAHRLRATVDIRGRKYRWLAPFETLPTAPASRAEGQRGRFTAYVEREERDYTGARPVKDFRGWVWQEGRCLNSAKNSGEDCPKRSFFSLRLPVEVLRDALFQPDRPVWPPPDLADITVRIEVLPPEDEAPLFDSNADGAAPPFALTDLGGLLLPGETLALTRRVDGRDHEIARLAGKADESEPASPLLTRLIRQLPIEQVATPVTLRDEIGTALGHYGLELQGDARSVDRALAVVATRLAWFVGAMLLALLLAWAVMELGVIHRIGKLTRRSQALSSTVKSTEGLKGFDLADLKGRDELGILATCLNDLLRRVKEDAERERLRAEQEKDQWHAVGHEIVSPLQSLLALHATPDDASHRYLKRMQQAVRTLYGSASVSEAFEASRLQLDTLDLAAFMKHVAANAGIEHLRCEVPEGKAAVRADEYRLEDVFAHILRNAERYRLPGGPITMRLATNDTQALITIHNQGPPIPEDLLPRIFEYGVSDPDEPGDNAQRGQGLFVAKTYMAKMGGSIAARNESDGVSFLLWLGRG